MPAGIAANKLGTDTGQFGLDGWRLDDIDHRAPAGQLPYDVQRGGRGDSDPGPAVAGLAVGVAVPPEPVERGPGFVTASVTDPFGNILGVMLNRHYLEILASRAGAVT